MRLGCYAHRIAGGTVQGNWAWIVCKFRVGVAALPNLENDSERVRSIVAGLGLLRHF